MPNRGAEYRRVLAKASSTGGIRTPTSMSCMLTGRGSSAPCRIRPPVDAASRVRTDDPMMRPLVKYPINHHLGQILERCCAHRRRAVGPRILEGSTFRRQRAAKPSSAPSAGRFGDSWSTRATLLPAVGTEVQGSYARVASPEEVTGHGLDQTQAGLLGALRSMDTPPYFLAEWARTVERDPRSRRGCLRLRDRRSWKDRSSPARLAWRCALEQTDRPEEGASADPLTHAASRVRPQHQWHHEMEGGDLSDQPRHP
jgi:hypothetical protein